MAINVTANVTPFAVIQVKPGIGDVIWHLPFIRAIAGTAPGSKVTFFAPPTSAAKDLLAAEPSVASTVYFRHAGSELQRGINLIRLVALLRRYRPQSLWILDRTIRPALAARLAGIPERIGLGLGPQSAFITNRGIGQDHLHDHPIDWLRALMTVVNVPLASTEPDLHVSASVLRSLGRSLRNSSARGRRHRSLRPIRLDAGFDLLEIHSRHRAGGRPPPRRHGAHCARAGARTDRALSVAAEGGAGKFDNITAFIPDSRAAACPESIPQRTDYRFRSPRFAPE